MDILSIMRSYHSKQGTADIEEPNDVSDAVGGRGGQMARYFVWGGGILHHTVDPIS